MADQSLNVIPPQGEQFPLVSVQFGLRSHYLGEVVLEQEFQGFLVDSLINGGSLFLQLWHRVQALNQGQLRVVLTLNFKIPFVPRTPPSSRSPASLWERLLHFRNTIFTILYCARQHPQNPGFSTLGYLDVSECWSRRYHLRAWTNMGWSSLWNWCLIYQLRDCLVFGGQPWW